MDRKIASPLLRILAFLIDSLLILLFYLVCIRSLSLSTDIFGFLNRITFVFVLIIFVFPVFYALLNSFLISTLGGTLGKLLTGTKIATAENNNVSFLRAFFRNSIGYMVSGVVFYMGFFWMFIDKERRTWHDQIADTYVVVRSNLMFLLGLSVIIILIMLSVLFISEIKINFTANKNMYMELISIFTTSAK